MLLTITLTVATLVLINFLLLIFSVNKVNKSKKDKRIVVLNSTKIRTTLQKEVLAPTGS